MFYSVNYTIWNKDCPEQCSDVQAYTVLHVRMYQGQEWVSIVSSVRFVFGGTFEIALIKVAPYHKLNKLQTEMTCFK